MKRIAPTRRIDFDSRRFVADVMRLANSRGMTISGVGLHIGVQYATLSRMRLHGRNPDVPSMLAMAAWAGLDPLKYFVDREVAELDARAA
jgi:hypothetical protein